MDQNDDASNEKLLASAVRFLIEGGEDDAASVLISCRLQVEESGDSCFVGDETHYALHVKLMGPRVAYDIFDDQTSIEPNSTQTSIRRAIGAVIPAKTYVKHFSAHAEIIEIDMNWRTELLEIARGRGVHNQIADPSQARVRLWNNLRFRSQSEVRVAEALDRAGVFFLPNCKGRLTTNKGRENREADFLICQNGKWGILEVDGEPFHPPSRTVQDHERDRLFISHGIPIVQHYDANNCFNNADGIVREFLKLLNGS